MPAVAPPEELLRVDRAAATVRVPLREAAFDTVLRREPLALSREREI
jgi:hypothetical protein